jgi:hypothetical protein
LLLESLPEKYLALVEDSPVLAEDYLAGNHATGVNKRKILLRK